MAHDQRTKKQQSSDLLVIVIYSPFSSVQCIKTKQCNIHNSTQQENTDAGVRHLYVHINIIEANYENNITL